MKIKYDGQNRGQEYGVVHIIIDSASSLVEAYAANTPAQNEFEFLLDLGSIYVNNERIYKNIKLTAGDHLRIHSQPRRFLQAFSLSHAIVFENESVLVVNKPAGIPVHALVDNARENLITWLEEERGSRLFITHRLDIETAGLLLLAKNKKVQNQINSLFATKQITRRYQVFTEHILKAGHFTHYMKPTATAPKIVSDFFIEGYQRCEMIIHESKKDKQSKFNEIWNSDDGPFFCSEVELLTGRTQQIRSQFAHLGEPIVGDVKYKSELIVTAKDSLVPAIGLRSFYLDLSSLNIPEPIVL